MISRLRPRQVEPIINLPVADSDSTSSSTASFITDSVDNRKVPFQNSLTQPRIIIPETQNLVTQQGKNEVDQFVSQLLNSQEIPNISHQFYLKPPTNLNPGVADWKVLYFQVNYLCNFMPSLVNWPTEEFVCNLSAEELKFYFDESAKIIVQNAQNP